MRAERGVAALGRLRQVLLRAPGSGPSDGDLLERFRSQRDPDAFAALVARHGPMVLGVCRRVLGNVQDAEDAFQATFLVLVRRAGAVRCRESVGSFLYGVAYRTAQEARSALARRHAIEKQVAYPPEKLVQPREATWDLGQLLDRELARLPAKYRAALVLCDLEGASRRKAARALGVPEGTVSSRLAWGRQLLARRLARRGVTLSAGALVAGISAEAAAATVPAALAEAIVGVAVGKGTLASCSGAVAALAERMVRAMVLAKIKIAASVLLAVSLLGAGAGMSWRGASAQGTAAPNEEASTPPAKDRNVRDGTAKGTQPEGPVTDQARWKVLRLDRKGALPYINLGSADGARPQLAFFIHAVGGDGRLVLKPKGELEVVTVLGDHLSQARVTWLRSPDEPILAGDVLVNPLLGADADKRAGAIQAAALPADRIAKEKVWVLDFRFKDVKPFIWFDIRKGGWYLVYEVANPTTQPHPAILDFELVLPGEATVHRDEVLPLVENVIRKREDPTGERGLKNSVTIASEPIPPSTDDKKRWVAGVAVFERVDPKADRFTVYITGLSNAWTVTAPAPPATEPLVRRKTLQLDFKRVDGTMTLLAPARWVYRGTWPRSSDPRAPARFDFDPAALAEREVEGDGGPGLAPAEVRRSLKSLESAVDQLDERQKAWEKERERIRAEMRKCREQAARAINDDHIDAQALLKKMAQLRLALIDGDKAEAARREAAMTELRRGLERLQERIDRKPADPLADRSSSERRIADEFVSLEDTIRTLDRRQERWNLERNRLQGMIEEWRNLLDNADDPAERKEEKRALLKALEQQLQAGEHAQSQRAVDRELARKRLEQLRKDLEQTKP